MVLAAAEVPVRLAMLDQTGQAFTEIGAHVVHIDANYALILLDDHDGSRRLHWGAPVRFEIEEDSKRYEVTGTIVARHNAQADDAADVPDSINAIPTWDLRIRIWDCKMNVQRRSAPRRRIGFPVQLSGVFDGPQDPEFELRVPILARCVDIGAGGIRVRTEKVANIPTRMRLEFSLPLYDNGCEGEAPHKFSLSGRVIRALPQGRKGDHMDIAFCFEGLTVRDGMALHNLLA